MRGETQGQQLDYRSRKFLSQNRNVLRVMPPVKEVRFLIFLALKILVLYQYCCLRAGTLNMTQHIFLQARSEERAYSEAPMTS